MALQRLLLGVLLLWVFTGGRCILFPQDNSCRLTKELNGLWNFRADFSPGRKQGFDEKWFSKPLVEVGPERPAAVVQ